MLYQASRVKEFFRTLPTKDDTMTDLIRFNVPYSTGKELDYIKDVIERGRLSGNNIYTQKCHDFFKERYQYGKCLLTTSCTDALEMSAILANIQQGDEVIMPSYTFVSTANAFVLRGAIIRFADSYPDNPNIDPAQIEPLVNAKTKAIVVVHYAGIACDMDPILDLALKYNLVVIEDAAQAIDSFYKGKPLGGLGHTAAFSFHETKNIISGEGGLLAVNHEPWAQRAEIIWEKGTNRSAFFRGEVDKYGWVDVGSSFLPADIVAAFLFAQLQSLEQIQAKRIEIWTRYNMAFAHLEIAGFIKLPVIPDYATNNAHMFFFVCRSLDERSKLIEFLKERKILAVFHYLSLHKSPFYEKLHDGRSLPNCDHFADTLVRLPIYCDMSPNDQERVVSAVLEFYKTR